MAGQPKKTSSKQVRPKTEPLEEEDVNKTSTEQVGPETIILDGEDLNKISTEQVPPKTETSDKEDLNKTSLKQVRPKTETSKRKDVNKTSAKQRIANEYKNSSKRLKRREDAYKKEQQRHRELQELRGKCNRSVATRGHSSSARQEKTASTSMKQSQPAEPPPQEDDQSRSASPSRDKSGSPTRDRSGSYTPGRDRSATPRGRPPRRGRSRSPRRGRSRSPRRGRSRSYTPGNDRSATPRGGSSPPETRFEPTEPDTLTTLSEFFTRHFFSMQCETDPEQSMLASVMGHIAMYGPLYKALLDVRLSEEVAWQHVLEVMKSCNAAGGGPSGT